MNCGDKKPRGTINFIEPYIYVLYCLQFKNNISPNRVLDMWKDERLFNSYSLDSRRQQIKNFIITYLRRFWSANQVIGSISFDDEIIRFIKKHNSSRFIRWFYRI